MQTQFNADRQAIASAGGGQPPQQPPMPQQPQQQAAPAQAAQPAPQTQAPQQQQPGRLDLNSVFPPMPEMQSMDQVPWRQQLRTWAYHPQAGPALRKLASMIDKQHGPNY